MKKARIILVFATLIISCTVVYAQKIEKICGEYTYTVPENVTFEQAKRNAIEYAKINALAKKFGTIVSQANTIYIHADNETFSSLGGTEVKGEWLEDTKEPELIRKLENGIDIITAKVCGKAREITTTGIDFSAKILNHPDAKSETAKFQNGESFYLSFRSPVEGYLTVYLLDNETVYCLLPYMKNPAGKEKIKAGNQYIFFSRAYALPAERAYVDEYELTCQKPVEQNFIYLIFSPNEFTKANDGNPNDESLPRELSFVAFQNWLTKNRQRDKQMEMKIIPVTIEKK